MRHADDGRIDRAREAARVYLTHFSVNGQLKPRAKGGAVLGASRDWMEGNLKQLAEQAPQNASAWEQCAMALVCRRPDEPGFDSILELAAAAMRGDVKRPTGPKHKYWLRDAHVVVAVDMAATQAGPSDGSLTMACGVVADVLNDLGERDARRGDFTADAVEAIWKRRRKAA